MIIKIGTADRRTDGRTDGQTNEQTDRQLQFFLRLRPGSKKEKIVIPPLTSPLKENYWSKHFCNIAVCRTQTCR